MLMQLLYIAFWWNLETLRFCLSVCLSNICFLNKFITWFKTFRITSLQHITHSRRLSPLYIIKCFGESVVNVVHCLIWSFLHSIILTKELHTSLAQHWHQWLTFFLNTFLLEIEELRTVFIREGSCELFKNFWIS